MSLQHNEIIYLDHAATSWPKPPEVIDAVVKAMQDDAANPGRGSHRMAVRASRILFDARKKLSKLFHIKNPNDIAFTSNTTMALNMAIKGWLKQGDHVIATSVEHNSVRRPLYELERSRGVQVTYIEGDEVGLIDVKEIEAAIQSNTVLIVVNHSSNLLGTILPVSDIGEVAKKHGVKLLVDAAQSAGVLPIDVEAMGIHMLAFPGHKGLLGPQGTGGLYIASELELEPLLHGGTGSQSEALQQPLVRPDRYEAGTQNTPGLAGLQAGVQYILNETVEKIHTNEWALAQRLMEGLKSVNGIRLLGPELNQPRTGIASFTASNIDPSEMAFILDQYYGIAVRSGYHCTPLAHHCAGTEGTGAVRASVGVYTTEDDISALIAAVSEIVEQYDV
ncbi:aminotransferase class V-fold PLP-dependent enzyme [Paenibacillus sp. J5C_2022]|uniref:aminotransferase class V-fold PLP-dependent enzyme n=1 Tax=Paenibacillus sp. J5C2022 TaxID=2977129 RepID=UPI0021D07680|nr:aminotransferase class V-fold PLP-dependent enzyme [Paenibacillus sp. J5C2022]MCU6710992.1 aminotransferase class V-fold PLP-dependent enzyme [Paenibacillus sp. J5C2022]